MVFLIEKGVCLWVSLVMKVLLGGVLCLGGLEKGFSTWFTEERR